VPVQVQELARVLVQAPASVSVQVTALGGTRHYRR
jgi:hypothetical protein